MRAVFPETDSIDDFTIDAVLRFDDRKRAARAFLTGRAHEPFLSDLAKRLMGVLLHVYKRLMGSNFINSFTSFSEISMPIPSESKSGL